MTKDTKQRLLDWLLVLAVGVSLAALLFVGLSS
jgi:hypothetical protein